MFRLDKKFGFWRMGVEADLFKDLYREAISMVGKKLFPGNQKPALYEVYQKEDKEKRIYTLEPDINFGRIRFSQSLSQTAKEQLKVYPHCEKNDFLDAMEIIKRLANPNNRFKAMDFGL